MKKLLTFLVFALLCNTLFSATPDSTFYCDDTFNISPHEQCFVFSSMDWYDNVIVYDINNNKVVKRINVKREARKQISQIIFVPYMDWGVGEYVIVAKGKTHREECKFIIKETYTMMIYNN